MTAMSRIRKIADRSKLDLEADAHQRIGGERPDQNGKKVLTSATTTEFQ